MSIAACIPLEFPQGNMSSDRIVGGADLAKWPRVTVLPRLLPRLRAAGAAWLVVLSALPFTAPFRTCDVSMLFAEDARPSRAALPTSPAGAASTDASLQPSSVAVTTARVRLAALAAGSERALLLGPFMTRRAPSAMPSDRGGHPSRPTVLRI
jgi:hypothetical protein